jgi:transposase InsO family protein
MITEQIERFRQEHGAGHVGRLCQAAGLPRATYYRLRTRLDEPEAERDTELRAAIHEVALAWPQYGYRRITAELRRRGVVAGRKGVLRLMREDNLLCLRKRRYAITTDSDHGLPVYPNLAATLDVTGTDQLWVADLTYIRLRREFVYLAVVLDAFSRRVIGWSLGRSLEAELAVSALRDALATRVAGPRLVHHSDRGVQYASTAYTGLLVAHGVRISMSRRGNPYDNARAESFMKTLKHEEVLVNEYATLTEARASIGDFLDRIYNHERLHSALGYRPPVEYEQMLAEHLTAP